MPQRLVTACLLLVMLIGCASAKKSFKEGSASESEGRWAQAGGTASASASAAQHVSRRSELG